MANNDVYEISASNIRFQIDSMGRNARFWARPYVSSVRGRFWSGSLATEHQRDIGVHSEIQHATVTAGDNAISISYTSLVDEAGQTHPCDLVISVTTDGSSLQFTATGTVAESIRFQEFALPVMELEPLNKNEPEVLYRAEGLGREIQNPRTTLSRAHTEYMVDNGIGIWELAAYPGELSMPWHGLQTSENFLYLGRHDPEFSSTIAASGTPARGGHDELWFSMITPTDRHQIAVNEVVLTNLVGDWKKGTEFYRAWANSWYTGPAQGPKPTAGWQRIIMRHQYGKIYFRYNDLIDVFEESQQYGLDGILLFGWWKGGFDKGYPVYEADPELGGAEELRQAIKYIQDRGGFISLYANGNLIDRTTAYFRDHAAAVSKKDYRGLDYVVGYDFAGDARTSRHFSANSFTIACHGAPHWREQMIKVARTQAELGADSIFYDQTGYHMAAWPCFDESHEHGNRVGIEPLSRIETLKELRKAANNATLGSEGMGDCMIPYLNFHHGWGIGFRYEDEAFPALFRQTFPEPVVSNRFTHDEIVGWKNQLSYSFVYNLAFDVSIHRGRAKLSKYPAYAKYVRTLTTLRAEYSEFFEHGKFDLISSDQVVHASYRLADRSLEVYWNTTNVSRSISECDLTLQAHEIGTIIKGSHPRAI